MSKIQTTMASPYCSDWGILQAVRDLIANGRDAEIQNGAKLTVDHYTKADGTGVLRIENEGTTIPMAAWLNGYSTKAGRSDLIGVHGEGFGIATMVAVRAGYKVKIRNGGEVWTPVLEESETFSGQTVLSILVERGRKPENRVRIEIEGIDKSEWEEMKKCFLFLSTPKTVVKCSTGSLIKDSDFAGKVYVKGVFVQRDPALKFGYDLFDVGLDRDRRMIESWNLQYKTRNILLEAMNKTTRDDGDEGLPVDALYDLLADASATEAQGVSDANSFYMMSSASAEALAAKFKKDHGENALPVSGLAESRDIQHLGKTGIVVAKPLAAALSKIFGTGEKLVEELKKEVVKTYSWGELTGAEQDCLLEALVLVDGVRPTSLDTISIVDFRSASLLGQEKGKAISLAKKLLSSVDDTLFALVHEVAHATSNGDDGEQSHVLEIQRIWGGIVKGMRSEKAQKAGSK